MNIHAIFVEKIKAITSDSRWIDVSRVISPKVPEITEVFYTELQSIPDLNRILANKVVDRRLHSSLEGWLSSLLKNYCDEDVFHLISNQNTIGSVHSKINLDIASFTYGLDIIKREIVKNLKDAGIGSDDLYWMIQSTGQLIDILNTFITESFFLNQIKHEQQENSLRIIGIIENVAVECERLRSSLFDWGRLTVSRVYEVTPGAPINITLLKDSDFGLWVMYKSEYLNQSVGVTNTLWEHVADIDAILTKIIDCRKQFYTDDFFASLNVFNNLLTKLSEYISIIADHSLDAEKSTDTLTRVLNRRYMNTVLRRLTNTSIQENVTFSILLADIDDFKVINDDYGHKNGDSVLSAFASRLMGNLKKSDFIFRYGGEEFLIVLSAAEKTDAENFAISLCNFCGSKPFLLDDNLEINVTCSIGVSTHDGHPDYIRLIEKADRALYKAKAKGKNQAYFLE